MRVGAGSGNAGPSMAWVWDLWFAHVELEVYLGPASKNPS